VTDYPPHQVLLSLPPAMAGVFAEVGGKPYPGWFAGCDPEGVRLGSGGGLVRLLYQSWVAGGRPETFEEWLAAFPKLAVLAGGQSRRLPAYAASGKILTPMPALRWETGQRIDGTLLDFMLPEYLRVLEAGRYPVMVSSGDVVLRFPARLPDVPEGDLAVMGMWVPAEVAGGFGVFFCSRKSPGEIAFVRQKPSPAELRELAVENVYVVDSGVWMLGARALDALLAKCGWDAARQAFADGEPSPYELYADFGPALGGAPCAPDPVISGLRASVVPVEGADFFHLGTNRQLLESMSALQNRELDQFRSGPMDRKPHPDVYVLNSDFAFRKRGPANHRIWVENCELHPDEPLVSETILTGISCPHEVLALPPGICLDVFPVTGGGLCVRPYGFEDAFKGPLGDPSTLWLGEPARVWFERRGLALDTAGAGTTDLQLARLFPVVKPAAGEGPDPAFLRWMCAREPEGDFRDLYLRERISAMEATERADLRGLSGRRRALAARILPRMRGNAASNPFYRMDLASAAELYPAAPDGRPESGDPNVLVGDAMFRAAVLRKRGETAPADAAEAEAFGILRETILASVRGLLREPRRMTLDDQIVWGRSPVRLDLAGGWSDTPPYCFARGGGVVNVAADVNGQPPVQAFVRFCESPVIVLRSIDLGIGTRIETYDELARFGEPGSGFALARAALCLAGFHPAFGARHASLAGQLQELGGGLEISLLAAVPKGSGLGTSSILGATLLGVLSDACGLGWTQAGLVRITLAVEQMLTTCGGWQDQAGAVYPGVKFLESRPGLDQHITPRWAPERVFLASGQLACCRLYYTGITRMASGILREIVRGMFLNSAAHLAVLARIRANADAVFEALLRSDYSALGRAVASSWRLNCRLDPGTDPPEVRAIFHRVRDYVTGGKLLGAGGGGYALFLAKDEEAARRLQHELESHPPNAGARFVDFSVSSTGLQITRS